MMRFKHAPFLRSKVHGVEIVEFVSMDKNSLFGALSTQT